MKRILDTFAITILTTFVVGVVVAITMKLEAAYKTDPKGFIQISGILLAIAALFWAGGRFVFRTIDVMEEDNFERNDIRPVESTQHFDEHISSKPKNKNINQKTNE